MKDRFTTKIDTSIASAVDYLTQDEVVAIPTETVYGLAANALSEKAVLKIFEAKNRPHFNPLIVHIKDWKEAEKYSSFIHPYIQQLALAFCPGPLTFLVPKKDCIPDLVTAGSPYIALRVPNHNLSLSLLQAVSFPLAAPSANPFGYVSPVSAAHVRQGLDGKIPYILDHPKSDIINQIILKEFSLLMENLSPDLQSLEDIPTKIDSFLSQHRSFSEEVDFPQRWNFNMFFDVLSYFFGRQIISIFSKRIFNFFSQYFDTNQNVEDKHCNRNSVIA